jgi:hypothetical protein
MAPWRWPGAGFKNEEAPFLLSGGVPAAEVRFELTTSNRRQGDQFGPGHHDPDHTSMATLKLSKVEPEKGVQVRVGPAGEILSR